MLKFYFRVYGIKFADDENIALLYLRLALHDYVFHCC